MAAIRPRMPGGGNGLDDRDAGGLLLPPGVCQSAIMTDSPSVARAGPARAVLPGQCRGPGRALRRFARGPGRFLAPRHSVTFKLAVRAGPGGSPGPCTVTSQ